MVYFPSLEGVRGWGCVMVMLYHFGVPVLQSAWLMMSMFFVVSGFVITLSTLGVLEKHGELSVVGFWSRRVSRLLPALLIFILVAALQPHVVGWLSGTPLPDAASMQALREDLLCGLFYSENWVLLRHAVDYWASFRTASPVRHLWSLSVEEQYYFVWPLLVYLWTSLLSSPHQHAADPENPSSSSSTLSHRGAFKNLLFGEVILIFASIAYTTHTYQHLGATSAYFSTISKLKDFAIGGAAALICRLVPFLSRILGLDPTLNHDSSSSSIERISPIALVICEFCCTCCVVLVFVFVPILPFSQEELFPHFFLWLQPVLSVVSALTLVLLALCDSLFRRSRPYWALGSAFVSSKPLVFLGGISYSLYIWHWPLIVWLGSPHQEASTQNPDAASLVHPDAMSPLRLLALCAASLLLAVFSHYCIEMPLQARAGSRSPRALLLSGLAASLCLALLILPLTVPPGQSFLQTPLLLSQQQDSASNDPAVDLTSIYELLNEQTISNAEALAELRADMQQQIDALLAFQSLSEKQVRSLGDPTSPIHSPSHPPTDHDNPLIDHNPKLH